MECVSAHATVFLSGNPFHDDSVRIITSPSQRHGEGSLNVTRLEDSVYIGAFQLNKHREKMKNGEEQPGSIKRASADVPWLRGA